FKRSGLENANQPAFVSSAGRFVEQPTNPFAGRQLIHALPLRVAIGRPRTALDQEPDDAGLLPTGLLGTAAASSRVLDGEVQRRRSVGIRLRRIRPGRPESADGG